MQARRWLTVLASIPFIAIVQAGAPAARAQAPASALADPALHDGQHDFDFLAGAWKIHLKRRLHPLTGSNEWVEFDGTTHFQKIWGGRGDMEDFDVDSPEKHIQIHGMTIRLYNPKTHQWHIYWANADRSTIDNPPVAGQFVDGVGEFYDQEDFEGKAIFVRYRWTNTTTDTPHFEQSFSADGGKNWEVNWITDQTRVRP
jgi:hypothetical protein